ncbi:MAG: hypothetical protein K9N51_00510 [Candidatus Pacebacteria bacterium]|nr:hypothetical protein [Candidatus Paceibacterota bacterium]
MSESGHTNGEAFDRAAAPHSSASLRGVFGILFFQPQFLLVLSQDKLSRALRILVGLAFVCGMVIAGAEIPRLLRAVTDWSGWFQDQVGAVWVKDGRLGWEHPEELPYTTRHRQWRIDFAGSDTAFPPPLRLGPEDRGVWISPDGVYAWVRLEGADEIRSTALFTEGKIMGVLEVDNWWPDGVRFQGEELSESSRKWLVRALPALVLSGGLRVVVQVLFYTFVFALIPYVMKSPLAAGGFRGVLTFYFYAGIPPLVVATVYASLNLPWADFNMFFVGGFILYLLAVVWRIGRSFGVASVDGEDGGTY